MAETAYDDIVVGSGAAGAVLAARLSEDAQRRVLLLEAGPDFATIEETPPELVNRRRPVLADYGWNLSATVLPGRRIAFPRGKVIGGSSAINGAVALRGAPADFDEWASLGCTGWSWNDVLPFFRRLEDEQDFVAPYHSQGGPIPIRRTPPDELSPFNRAFLEACCEAGFPACPDHNAPVSTGVGSTPLNVRGEIRVSTAIGYLQPARDRPNLVIRGGCLVDRVLFDGDRANGVALLGNETIAGRRVTLAAGVFGSPAILLRSGIGPAASLKALGIPVRAESPGVGGNLADHPSVALLAVPRPGAYEPDAQSFQTVLRYTAPGSSEENDLHLLAGSFLDASSAALAGLGVASAMACSSVLHRPRSLGSVTIPDVDPRNAPRIDLHFLDDSDDLRRTLAGVRTAWRVLQSPTMDPVLERVLRLDRATIESDDALAGYVRATVSTSHHPVGTVRMGTDDGAVVDSHGRVRGVHGLRVADAAIMPRVPRANTHLTTIMIGERIADWLRGEDD